MRSLYLALACVALLASTGAAAQDDRMAPGEPHESDLRLGELPPTSFELAGAADGTRFDLEAQRGERPILLLFFRGTW